MHSNLAMCSSNSVTHVHISICVGCVTKECMRSYGVLSVCCHVCQCVGIYIQCTCIYIHTDLLKEIEANSADYKAKVMRSPM